MLMYTATIQQLEEMLQLLREDGVTGWVPLFTSAKQAIEAGNPQECGRIILGGSGGMGSLNDLVLGQTTDSRGNFAWKPGYEKMNNRYQTLLDSLYEFAHNVRSGDQNT